MSTQVDPKFLMVIAVHVLELLFRNVVEVFSYEFRQDLFFPFTSLIDRRAKAHISLNVILGRSILSAVFNSKRVSLINVAQSRVKCNGQKSNEAATASRV